jgi:hypothetical protein
MADRINYRLESAVKRLGYYQHRLGYWSEVAKYDKSGACKERLKHFRAKIKEANRIIKEESFI